MKSLKIFIYSTCALALTLAGFAATRFFNVTEAQTAKKEIAWQHAEIPLQTFDSTFKLNLPPLHGTDWIVGVKPVADGEKERMYAGVFT